MKVSYRWENGSLTAGELATFAASAVGTDYDNVIGVVIIVVHDEPGTRNVSLVSSHDDKSSTAIMLHGAVDALSGATR